MFSNTLVWLFTLVVVVMVAVMMTGQMRQQGEAEVWKKFNEKRSLKRDKNRSRVY